MSAPCPACGLKAWDADDLIPGEYVCTCDDMDDVWCQGECGDPRCHPDLGRPIVTVDTGGLL